MIFYGQSGWIHSLMLFLSILWVYFITRSKFMEGSRWRLGLAVLFPISVLIYFKYSNFIIENIFFLNVEWENSGFSLFHNALLPAGISFFTFQLISFAIDRYRGLFSEPPFIGSIMLYVSFFPQLIAGPIVRFQQVSEAIEKLPTFKISCGHLSQALSLITIGLAYKVLIADSLHNYLAPLLKVPDAMGISGLSYLVTAYSFQIYFDFYGYSLIAIGLGNLFGFKLPINFRSPYSALNPKEFWRRWHISLSNWIRDYLYLPLGGNKQYIRNIMIVFVVCGLWHGAGFTFIIWGLFHALIVIFYHLNSKIWDAAPKIIQWMVTFSLVSFSWLFFALSYDNLSSAIASIWRIELTQGIKITYEMGIVVIVAALVCFFIKAERVAEYNNSNRIISFGWGGLLGSIFFLSLLFVERSETFIYFRF
jgi:alginate O-acetyltransferase complex protein AlgI